MDKTKNETLKNNTLQHIQDQTGIVLDICQDFPKVRNRMGKKSFNATVENHRDIYVIMDKLYSLSNQSKIIDHVERNGISRIAIFLK